MVCLTAYCVGKTVVSYIYHDVQIITTNRLVDNTFSLARTESRCRRLDNVAVFVVVLESTLVSMLVLSVLSPAL